MEVKSVFMDLQEGVKKGNVWKLESEAFKKPIEIKIWYEDKDKSYIENIRKEIEKKSESYDRKITELESKLEEEKKVTYAFEKMLCKYEELIDEYEKKIEKKDEETKLLIKEIANLKTTSETQSWAILHLQEQTSLIQKKITKQPTIIHDKWFISWRESSGLWMINIPDGDYLMIAKYVVWEHNEYVTNCDQLIMEKIHVEGQHYIPFYKLEWGTELDTPTATIYYDLVFMPL